MTVSMVNPARVKHVAKGLAVKSKTATLDAVIVARYGRLVKPPAWPPPPPESKRRSWRGLRPSRPSCAGHAIAWRRLRSPPYPHRSWTRCITVCVSSTRSKPVSSRPSMDHIDRHPRRQQDRQLLASIPAVGPKTAWRMRAALDMAVVVATQHNPALRAALAFAPQLPWRAQTSNPLSATIRLKTLDR